MVSHILVSGDLSEEDVATALHDYLKGKESTKQVVVSKETSKAGILQVVAGTSTANDESQDNGEEKGQSGNPNISVNPCIFDHNQKLIAAKDKELTKLEKTSSKALASVQTFHLQQKQLFDEFVLLRQRYDEQKTQLLEVLWEKCAGSNADLSEIPECENAETFLEDSDVVGVYNLGEVLGEGQFALVRGCNISHSRGDPAKHDLEADYALKVLNKERLLSFHSLKRVSNEIKILRMLDNPYIVKTYDVIQTKKKLYIVTEKGGLDLFEFFDEHPDGVPESWAREIVRCTLTGVLYCHQNNICHRDLKPENILVKFDVENGVCDNLKLCDFGLASQFMPDQLFDDFCGSPGFFAPEMITRGTYFGDKVDVWSCGCILLELVLGHHRFCEIWMVAYDYEVMQEKSSFSKEIKGTLEKLITELDFSDSLNDFIMQFLQLRQSLRPRVSAIMGHEWLGLTDEEKLVLGLEIANNSNLEIDTTHNTSNLNGRTGSPVPDAPIGTPEALSRADSTTVENSGHTNPELLKNAFHNQSTKERRFYEDFNKFQPDQDQVHLPPIEPQTPNVVQARKILLKGDDLARKVSGNGQSNPGTPSAGSSPSTPGMRMAAGGGGGGWQTPAHSPKMKGSASDPSIQMQMQTASTPLTPDISSSVVGAGGLSPLSPGVPGLIHSPLLNSPKPTSGKMGTGSIMAAINEVEGDSASVQGAVDDGSRTDDGTCVNTGDLSGGAAADSTTREGKDDGPPPYSP